MLDFLKALCFLTAFILVRGQDTPKSCNESISMTFDAKNFSGIWYEVGRSPAPATSVLCTQVNLTLQPNNVMDIKTIYSVTPQFPWINQTVIASVDLSNTSNPYGYNFSYTLRDPLPVMTYKLLKTDYDNYALICGYQNYTDNSTFFNILLTRDRMPSGSDLIQYEDMASQNFTGFSNSSLAVIVQEPTCYLGNAGMRPFINLLLLFAVFYLNI